MFVFWLPHHNNTQQAVAITAKKFGLVCSIFTSRAFLPLPWTISRHWYSRESHCCSQLTFSVKLFSLRQGTTSSKVTNRGHLFSDIVFALKNSCCLLITHQAFLIYCIRNYCNKFLQLKFIKSKKILVFLIVPCVKLVFSLHSILWIFLANIGS